MRFSCHDLLRLLNSLNLMYICVPQWSQVCVLQSFDYSVIMSENRLKNFKNKGKDNDELRRRRNEVVELL